MKLKFTCAVVAIIATTLLLTSCKKNEFTLPCGRDDKAVITTKVFATGLNDPRGLKFGPDGNLYVAEAGIGGTNLYTKCMQVVPPVGPYTGSNTGSRISKINMQGVRTTFVDNLPSSTTAPTAGSGINGVADVAFIGNTLYGLLAGAGCSHAVPDIPNGVFKAEANKKWTLINNYSAFLQNHPVAHPNPADFEPDGTPYSMISVAGNLYVVEPNHGELDRVMPNGNTQRVIDISATQGHIVPTCVAYHNGNFYISNLNTFPIVQGSSKIYKVTPDGHISVFASGFTTVLGIVFDSYGGLYVLENTVGNSDLTPGFGDVVRLDPGGDRQIIISGLNLPSGITFGPDGKLYVSNWGIGPPGNGQILQIGFKCKEVYGDKMN